MFHKTRRLNHQPAKFKIKSTLLNIDAKVIQENKKQYFIFMLQFFVEHSKRKNTVIKNVKFKKV